MLRKSVFRTIRHSLGRYFAILSIIALGVGFFAGLRVTEPSMRATADEYISSLGLYDFRLISTLGLTDEDVDAFRRLDGIGSAVGSVSADLIVPRSSGANAVLHAHTLLDGVNGVDLLWGRMPERDDECVLDSRYAGAEMLGQTIVLSDDNDQDTRDKFRCGAYTVVGIVNAVEYINFQRGTTALADGKAAGFLYLLPGGFNTECYTEVYLRLSQPYEIYSDAYDAALDAVRGGVEDLLAQRAALRYDTLSGDARAELDDAIAVLNEKKAELADAQREVNDGWTAYRDARAEAESALEDSRVRLNGAWEQLSQGRAALEAARAEPSAALPQVQAMLEQQAAELAQAEAVYYANYAAYTQAAADAAAEFDATEQQLRSAQAEIDGAGPDIAQAEQDIADGEAALADLERPTVYTLDRSANFGYASYENDIAIVSGVARVFPLFFFLVAALVCITTMTRMVGEQRTQNGVLKALGYRDFAIAGQYLFYAGSASLIGCAAGFFLGCRLMPMALWQVYAIMYSIDRPCAFLLDWKLLFVCGTAYLVCMQGVTYLVCRSDLRQCAAQLMRPEAPSAGKRIFLERIGFLWRPMKFLHKVSARNILRYKKRMVMMLIGIGGCMALLLTGFGIRDSIQPIVAHQFDEISLYDATVSFRRAPTAAEQDAFLQEVSGLASRAALLHAGSGEVLSGGGVTSVNLIAGDAQITDFIDFHAGDTAVAWPGQGQVIINCRLAQACGLAAGDVISLRSGSYAAMEATVAGVFDNYIYDYIYMDAATYEAGFGTAPEQNTAYLRFAPGQDDHAAGAALLSMSNVAAVSISSDLREAVGSMLESLDLIVLIVLVCAGALAFIVLYNLTNITITERTREIATLKVLGFHRKEQNSYVFRENIILSILGALCGIPAGIALLHYTMSQIRIEGFYFGCRLAGASYLWGFLITVLFTVIADLTLTGKTRRINMAEAMKAVE